MHLPALSLWDGENLWKLTAGTVLPTLHIHVIFKNWHLCGACWEECERKNFPPPPPPGVATTISRLFKVNRGDDIGAYSLATAGCIIPPNPSPKWA